MDGSDISKTTNSLVEALPDKEKEKQYPIVILKQGEKKIIRSTRFLDIP